jgi:hypothetical protein
MPSHRQAAAWTTSWNRESFFFSDPFNPLYRCTRVDEDAQKSYGAMGENDIDDNAPMCRVLVGALNLRQYFTSGVARLCGLCGKRFAAIGVNSVMLWWTIQPTPAASPRLHSPDR